MVREFKGVNFAIKQSALPKSFSSWFNTSNMRRLIKPTLFGLGIVVAGLIATNPKFILPYKYHFSGNTPAVTSEAVPEIPVEETDLESATALPDGFTPESESATQKSTGVTEPAGQVEAAVTGATKGVTNNKVWVAGNLSIPSLKISAPLVYVSERTEKVFQLGLQQGVVQYPGTALPGQLGNMYVFGHSSDYRWAKGSYKTVFAKLPDIKIGSEIKITDGAGKVYTYKVTSTAIALPNETKYLSQYKYQKKLLTVQTSYPVGTALKRFLAIAELVEN